MNIHYPNDLPIASTSQSPRIYDDITQTVGNTPLVRLSRLKAHHGFDADILAKVEYFNPAGSIKDRGALAMLDDLQAGGRIGPKTELVEATSGNNGVACAWACAMRGIPLTIVMPEHMSIERRKLIRHYGANLVLTPKELGTKGAIDEAGRRRDNNPDMIMLGQFSNPANPTIHRNTTAMEILRDSGGKVDVFVAGIGTGGTFSGVAGVLKAHNPNAVCIAVEPASCPVLSQGKSGVHKIQGLSSGHVPDILRTDLIDEVITIEDNDALEIARSLARIEGIAGGISSGAAAKASIDVASRPQFAGKTVVTIFADFAGRYVSTDLFIDD